MLIYEVEKGAPCEVMQIVNKEYFRLIEDFRRDRHVRITKFI